MTRKMKTLAPSGWVLNCPGEPKPSAPFRARSRHFLFVVRCQRSPCWIWGGRGSCNIRVLFVRFLFLMFLSFCTIIPFFYFVCFLLFLTFVVYCKNVPIGLPQVGNGSVDSAKSCVKIGMGEEFKGRGEQVGEVKRVKTGYNASIQWFQLSAGRVSLQHRHGNKGVTILKVLGKICPHTPAWIWPLSFRSWWVVQASPSAPLLLRM